MKKLYALLLMISCAPILFAQTPEKMSYQAVIRDAGGDLVTNTSIGMQISILQNIGGFIPVYVETQTKTTNINGLLSLKIGEGTIVTGSGLFADINWQNGPYFIKTETDPAGGTTYSIEGISELTSVPYTLQAKTATDLNITDQVSGDLVTYDGTNWVAKNAVISNTGGNLPMNNIQPFIVVNHIIALQGIFPSRSGTDAFIADIVMFGGNFAPRNWALCDGQLLAISSNTALFSLLGTIYGGDGRTTFGLPDMRGRTAIHPGNGPGLSSYRIGQRGGSETNTMTVSQMPSHNHTIIYQ
ncbi:tail fiber protein [Flavobacterium sp.]|jgi:microcystin-dependent protein|uniref:tail fiber protein n=1 Tax=Flavobacterium sp. TaxID=239 RepID=UPI002A82FE50|nr:tail fiber protein [Flavobacterium sp.]